MTSYTDLCLILLTYKSKVLLLQQENVLLSQRRNPWHSIKKIKEKDTTAERTIVEEVCKETLIRLDAVTLLSKVLYIDTVHHVFHARLTDTNVNNIGRGEGQLLQFFELKELPTLQLQPSTKLLFSQNESLINNLSIG